MEEISLTEIQRIELDLLLNLDRVCRRYKLRYYIDGGTLLGAVCYDGFIPWDDDIDIKMPRPDYEKLLTLQKAFPEHVFLDAPRPQKCDYVFLKIVDNRTVLEEYTENGKKVTGVYIDVLPLDGHPDQKNVYEKHLKRLSRFNSLFHASQSGFEKMKGSDIFSTKVKGYIYSVIYSRWSLYRKLTATAKKYPYDSSSKVGLLIEGDPIRERYEKCWLEPPVMLSFEGHCFPATNEAEKHLSIFYRKPISRDLYYQNLPYIPSAHRNVVYWKESDAKA